MSNLKVAILVPPEVPGASVDESDTFRQAKEINQCLTILGNQTLSVVFGDDRRRTARELTDAAPDLVFNLVEDVSEGADYLHLATALLDTLGLRHTGAPTAALEALGDKRRAQAILAAAGLPVPKGLADGPSDARYIVKSAIEHASIGLDDTSVVTGRQAAEAAIAERQKRLGGPWFAEAYIDGREFSLGLLETRAGLVALPASEILFLDHAERPKILGYEEKWMGNSYAYEMTPSADPPEAPDSPLLTELESLARRAWALFGLRGYARVDFRVDTGGQPYIVDVNANPCIAREAGFCAAAARIGISLEDVISHVTETALA